MISESTSPHLSFVLITTGRQSLITFSLRSILPQLKEGDEIIVSVNSSDAEMLSDTTEAVNSVDETGRIKIIKPSAPLPVYSHYRFAFESAGNDHVVIIHDDDVYSSRMADEIRYGFSNTNVRVVVGGLLKVDLLGPVTRISESTPFDSSGVKDGPRWMEDQPGLYPRFCYSALALDRSFLPIDAFAENSTAGDCLVIAQMAMTGDVYQSTQIFATWLQLPFRTSRWSTIDQNLVTPWKEFSEYYSKIGNARLHRRALDGRSGFLRSYTKMLFTVGIVNRSRDQIDGCLHKIYEISPSRSAALRIFRYRIVHIPLSIPLRIAQKLQRRMLVKKVINEGQSLVPSEILKIDPSFWKSFVTEASKLAF